MAARQRVNKSRGAAGRNGNPDRVARGSRRFPIGGLPDGQHQEAAAAGGAGAAEEEEVMACVREYRGKWVADWRDDDGKRFIKPFADKSGAHQFLGEIEKKLERGTFKAPETLPTFETLAADWLAERATNVCVATIAGYQAHIDLHLVPG